MSSDGSQHGDAQNADETTASVDFSSYLLPLERATSRTRGGVRRFGNKATLLAKFARSGVSVPQGWLLEASRFDSFVERSLPKGHDLRALIKRSETREGHEDCARAYEQLRSSPLDADLQDALRALWHEVADSCPLGLALRPSIAGSGAVELAGRHLHARVGLRSADELIDAVVAVWSSSVLSQAVAAYVEAGMKEVSVALLLQRVVPCDVEVWLSRLRVRPQQAKATADGNESTLAHDWHMGVSVDEGRRAWQPRRSQFAPLSQGQGGPHPPPDIEALRQELSGADFEQLHDMARAAEQLMGAETTLQLAMTRGPSSFRFQLLNALEGGPWLGLRGGTEQTVWSEVTVAMRGNEPALRLSQSLIERTVGHGLRDALTSLGCSFDSEGAVLSRWCGRSYLNVSDALKSAAALPMVRPADALFASGGLGGDAMRRLAAEVSVGQVDKSPTRRIWRAPQLAKALVKLNLGLDSATRRELDSVVEDGQALSEMDLTLLPNDALATTLRDAQRLVQRSVSVWLRSMAAQWIRFNAIQTLLQRRLGDVEPQIAYRLCRGVDGLLGPLLAQESKFVVEAFLDDEQARERLLSNSLRRIDDFPDGKARAAVGQFLVRYGDVALGSFELSRPRWSEDSSDFLAMIRLVLMAGEDEVAPPSRVLADRALASFEPDLSSLERRLLRFLIDKGKEAVAARARADLVVYAALARLRNVVVDVDRRLRRIDRSIGVGGAFHCSLERLSEALASGRPELGQVIRMRRAERGVQRLEPAPPSAFVASPPRGARQMKGVRNLVGLGVSSGVVDGRVRCMVAGPSGVLRADDILVLPVLDPALAPLLRIARGVVVGTGGALSLGAETLRELGVPAVASASRAMLELREGEPIRIDGGRGQIQRLARGERE